MVEQPLIVSCTASCSSTHCLIRAGGVVKGSREAMGGLDRAPRPFPPPSVSLSGKPPPTHRVLPLPWGDSLHFRSSPLFRRRFRSGDRLPSEADPVRPVTTTEPSPRLATCMISVLERWPRSPSRFAAAPGARSDLVRTRENRPVHGCWTPMEGGVPVLDNMKSLDGPYVNGVRGEPGRKAP